jgi:hypothetical protein
MPFELHWEPGGVVRRYIGHMTVAERELSFDQICQDPRFDLLAYTITDYLAVTGYEIVPEATEEIAARHIAPLLTNPGVLIAAVATDPRIIAAIGHFKSLGFVEPKTYRVFPTLAEARAWIASSRPAARPPRARGLD